MNATVCRPVALLLTALTVLAVPAGPVAAQRGRGHDDDEGPRRERTHHILLTGETDYSLRGSSGGEVPASDIAPGCLGMVSTEPDLIVEVDNGIWAHLSVESSGAADATLVVRSRQGTLCNDDADALTTDPEIVSFFAPGEYAVYVGAKDGSLEDRYRLHVTEASEDEFPTVRDDRPLRLQGVSGGAFDAAERAPACIGAISGRPSHVLRLERPELLYISAHSSSDLTLVVVGPDGTVHCNDDARGTLDPRIVLPFSDGLIRVYVGSHNPSINAYYSLEVGHVTSG